MNARDRRNLNPTPEAVFAMHHWHTVYAAQNGGSMDFWDTLSDRDKVFCRDAVQAIKSATEPHP